MFSEITKHLVHFLSLFAIIGVSLWGLLMFNYDKNMQTAIVFALGVSFVTWGVVHHYIHDDLHPKIVLEYIATAALGTVVLLTIIWR